MKNLPILTGKDEIDEMGKRLAEYEEMVDQNAKFSQENKDRTFFDYIGSLFG